MEDKMKKIYIIALTLIMALTLAFCAGCGSGGNDDTGDDLGDITVKSGDGDENNAIRPPVIEDPVVENAADAAYIEAYLDILTKNSAMLTTDEEWMFLGDGKIAVTSVFGNEAPELLYLYIDEDNEYNERLKIFTYSEMEGAVPVFDAAIYAMAGGGGNYCAYLTRGGDLIVYYSIFGEFSYYSFWAIEPMSQQDFATLENDPYYVYFSFENKDQALLYYWSYPDEENDWDMVSSYMQDGREISQAEFDARAQEIMGDVDRVLFQSETGLEDYGLYDRDDLWKGVTPFKAESMNYTEAVSWLEGQL